MKITKHVIVCVGVLIWQSIVFHKLIGFLFGVLAFFFFNDVAKMPKKKRKRKKLITMIFLN